MSFTRDHLSPAQLKDAATVRSYELTTAGRVLLDVHTEVVAKHLQKGLRFFDLGIIWNGF